MMPTGHHTRTITTHDGSRLHRALTYRLTTTTDLRRALRSKYTWHPAPGGRYILRPIGILHGLLGITLNIKGHPQP